MSSVDTHGMHLAICESNSRKLSQYRSDFERKSSEIHPHHVKTDEEFKGDTGALRSIVAVLNPVDLPVLWTDVESEPVTGGWVIAITFSVSAVRTSLTIHCREPTECHLPSLGSYMATVTPSALTRKVTH